MSTVPSSFSSYFLLAIAITGLSSILTLMLMRFGAKDVPNARSSHHCAISRNGGVAVAIGFYGGILGLSIMGQLIISPLWFEALCLGAIMAILGLADDLFSLPYRLRIIVQVLVALRAVTQGFHLHSVTLPIVGYMELGILGYLFSALWLVGVMNAYNFMDGLNGLAAGVALVLAVGVGFLGAPSYLAFCLFFAILGFFVFNFPSGKIFMGDAGSQFIGFMIGVLLLYLMTLASSSVELSLGPILLFAFLWDTILTLIRRGCRGEHIFTAHRDHLYQLLNRVGWSHASVSLLHFGFTALQIYVAYAVMQSFLSPFIGLGLLAGLQNLYTLAVLRRACRAGASF